MRVRTRHLELPNRWGAATVEFALTSAILFLLFFAALDFCRLSMLTHTAEQAAYEGARNGSLPGKTAANAQAAAQAELDKIGIVNSTITVSPNVLTAATAEVTVHVAVPLASNSWVTTRVLSGATINRSCTLTREFVVGD